MRLVTSAMMLSKFLDQSVIHSVWKRSKQVGWQDESNDEEMFEKEESDGDSDDDANEENFRFCFRF